MEAARSSQTGQAAGLFSTMRYLGSILGSSIMVAVLIGPTPLVENSRILYAALFLSACAAIFAGRRLPVWPKRGGDHEIEPSIPHEQTRRWHFCHAVVERPGYRDYEESKAVGEEFPVAYLRSRYNRQLERGLRAHKADKWRDLSTYSLRSQHTSGAQGE
jgi:hypothetical protein